MSKAALFVYGSAQVKIAGYDDLSTDGAGGLVLNSDAPPANPITTRFDYDINSNPIYIGYALSSGNPLTSQAVWAIKKITYDGSNRATLTQWAAGSSSYANIWDNRTSVSYQ